MIALIIAAALMHTSLDVDALITTTPAVGQFTSSLSFWREHPPMQSSLRACDLEKKANDAAGALRQALAQGYLFTTDQRLVIQIGGNSYHLTSDDRRTVEAQAVLYETYARDYQVDCGR